MTAGYDGGSPDPSLVHVQKCKDINYIFLLITTRFSSDKQTEKKDGMTYFVDHCLSLCQLSFGHGILLPLLFNALDYPFWYLQTFLKASPDLNVKGLSKA
jgi:hypothetical protein